MQTSAAPPAEWHYAVIESPLDPWGSDVHGRLALLDEGGQELWSYSFDGLQNGKGVAARNGLVYFSEKEADSVLAPGSGVARAHRESSTEAEVVGHGIAQDEEGSAMAFFNEGFTDSARGYSFMTTAFEDGKVSMDYSIDGYVSNVWSCQHAGWLGAVRSMLPQSDPLAGPNMHIGLFDSGGEFTAKMDFTFPPGTEISPALQLPCDDESGVLLTSTTDPSSEEDRPPVTDLSLWHMTANGATQHPLTAWTQKDEGTWLAHASAVVDDIYYWVTPEGELYSAPVSGGQVSSLVDLELPVPLPADAVVGITNEVLLIALPAGNGMETFSYTLGDLDSGARRQHLEYSPMEGGYISDVIVARDQG